MVEVKHIKPFEKENLIGKVLEEQKSASVASRNMDSSEVTILKNRTDRPPFRSLLVNSPSNTNSESPEEVKLNANPIKCQQIMEAGPFSVSSFTCFLCEKLLQIHDFQSVVLSC